MVLDLLWWRRDKSVVDHYKLPPTACCCSCMNHSGPCVQIIEAYKVDSETPLISKFPGLSAEGQ